MQQFDETQVIRTYGTPMLPTAEDVLTHDQAYHWEADSQVTPSAKSDVDDVEQLRSDNDRLRSVIRKLELQMHQSTSKASNPCHLGTEVQSKSLEANEQKSTRYIDINEVKSEVSHTMIEMQLRPENTTMPFPEDQRDLAMRLHYYSASAYDKLRDMGLKLPADRTVRRWVAETEVNVGFCDHIFTALKQAMREIPPDERCCALKWDEMSLMEREEYDMKTDVIEGFEDLGPLGRTDRRANHAFVFCLNGLHPRNQWRTMLAYFLPCNSVCGADIVKLLRICIDKIIDTGADLKMTVCDQGTTNGKAYSILKVSESQPFFVHQDRKIVALYDFPHAVKNVLGMLRKWGTVSVPDKIVKYSDFTTTFYTDMRCGTSNLLGHITETHMWPDKFARMNVSRAFQVFSKRFASAMELAHCSGAVQSDTIVSTAQFCRSMDKIIDACNSSSLYNPNPLKRPLCVENPDVEQELIDFLSWAPDMKVRAKGRWKRPVSFVGIVQTVRGILHLYYELRNEFPEFKLCTALCNQDSVEQLFSRIRGRGGFNPNPTCRMFRFIARHLISVRDIITSKRGNVVCSDLPYLPLTITEEETSPAGDLSNQHYEAAVSAVEFFEDGEFAPVDVSVTVAQIDSDTDTDSDSDCSEMRDNDDLDLATRVRLLETTAPHVTEGSYEANAITFFAGYTINKVLKIHACERCRDIMAKKISDAGNSNETYTECREYISNDEHAVISLKRPTDKFYKIVESQLQSFHSVFIRRKHKAAILTKLVNHAVEATKKIDVQWFDELDPCHSHRLFAVRFMLRVKLQRHCMFENRAAKLDKVKKRTENAAKRNKPSRKMRNILHT